MNEPRSLPSSTAFRFVLIIGIANLFADMTYEGARSVTGAYLGALGASAAVVGLSTGFGEFVGYAFRLATGYLSDRTGKYWLVTIAGYLINILAVPALALAGSWPPAAGLIITERLGRAIRKPSTEAMLSFAGRHLGSGWVFGVNQALDQTGATVGPLVVALVLFLKGGYHHSFAVLLIPALLCISTIGAARYFFPSPHDLDAGKGIQLQGLPGSYWLYLAGGACIAAGFIHFSLVAYHFQETVSVPPDFIAIFYAIAMATGAGAALILGRLLDRIGLPVLIAAIVFSSLSAPLLFWGNLWLAGLGVVLWGIGMSVQDCLLKALIAGLVRREKRGIAFGLFDTGFGIAWFVGSALMGLLYQHFLTAVILLSIVLQLASIPFFVSASLRQTSIQRRAGSGA